MPKRKRQSRKKLVGEARLKNAKRWLQSTARPKGSLVQSYAKRYGVTEREARDQLLSIGYYDEVLIEEYEQDGIEWKYMVEPLSGEMFVVPEGAEEHEIYEYHPII